MSQIIILSGSSCAGKSTLQKELQEILNEPHVKLGIDQLFDAVVPDFINLHNPPKYFDQNSIRKVVFEEKDDFPSIKLIIGEEGQKVINGMISAIKAYADAGCNVVVDYIGYDQQWAPKLNNTLVSHKVVWIKVNISLEALELREKARNTSPVGHARAHYDSIHDGIKYDFEVNTEKYDSKTCALQIKEYLLLHNNNNIV